MNDHARSVGSERAKLAQERVLRFALAGARTAMEDRRLAELRREGEVPAEICQLGEDGREDAVVIDPGLADRDDPVVARRAARRVSAS